MSNGGSPNPTVSAFVMYGAREVMESMPGEVHIAQHVVALEKAVKENPGFAFDLAKSLIETVCKTILTDRGVTFDGSANLPRLLRAAYEELPVAAEHAADCEIEGSIRKTLNGLLTAVQGLCELRRTAGLASHGRDAYERPLEPIQALLAARAADTMVHFLYFAHKGSPCESLARRLFYGDEPEFDEFVNSSHEPIRIFDLGYAASEVLFRVDLEAYRAALADFRAGADDS